MKVFFGFIFLINSLLVNSQVKDSLQLKYNYAKKYLYNDNWQEAGKISIYLLAVDSMNPKYQYLYADVCISGRMFESARKSINKAYTLDINKDSLKYYHKLEYLHFQSSQYDSARYYITKIIAFKKDSAALYMQRSLYDIALRDTVEYKSDLIKAAKLGDTDAPKMLRIYEGKEAL